MSDLGRMAKRIGIFRRCGWCSVRLRWWQLRMCRHCRRRAVWAAEEPEEGTQPPCTHASRWHEEPDPWGMR